MAIAAASAAEIYHGLQTDFRRRLSEYGLPAQSVDPVLAVLFRTFAHELEGLYGQTGRMRLALLDELIGGLGLAIRSARAAQTIVHFVPHAQTEYIEEGTALTGMTDSGEPLIFRTDASVMVSHARLSFAAVYESGSLQLLAPASMDEKLQASRPGLDPAPASLGPNPAIYLVFDYLPARHLSGHGVVWDLSPDGGYLQQALEWEPWCFLSGDGALSDAGLLRPVAGAGGVRHLKWLTSDDSVSTTRTTTDSAASPVLTGFYGSRTFVFPEIKEPRRLVSNMPKQLEPALLRIFGRNSALLFDHPRAWVRIGLPKECGNIHRFVSGIRLNSITASNIEHLNQTIYFDKHGTSIPLDGENGQARHLLAPLSITGESGRSYFHGADPEQDVVSGRYTIKSGRIELSPGMLPNGDREKYANVRLWMTAGSRGNAVGPGRTQIFQSKALQGRIGVINPTAAAGGSDQENFDQAQLRFHGALLSRDRAVTPEDLFLAVRTYDRRVRDVSVETVARRTPRGLRRIQLITIALNQDDFAVPSTEAQFLARELTTMVNARMTCGIEAGVKVRWV